MHDAGIESIDNALVENGWDDKADCGDDKYQK